MDKVDRVYELHKLFKTHRFPVPFNQLQSALDCSESTIRRTIQYMQDVLQAPLDYDRERNGWGYEATQAQSYELPGLWFTPDELYALLISHHLLLNVQPGILNEHIQPLTERIESLLNHKGSRPEIQNRIRILQSTARPQNVLHFQRIASALLERQRIRVLYHGRERDTTTERILSPQRLVYYRSNWYLDAYCHDRKALRTFSLDRLQPLQTMEASARTMAETDLNHLLTESYGIFAGEPTAIANLKFTAKAARWVADEQWHPKQISTQHQDGTYTLEVPYSDPREIIMDILKYGPEVEVLGPETLRAEVKHRLITAVEQY
jgi:predicted DNA-binding transcriptional regulator YafY